MRNLYPEPGCVYDTVAFLARFLDEAPADTTQNSCDNPNYYDTITERLSSRGAVIPSVLGPLTYRYKGRRSFLDLVLLGVPYSTLTYSHAAQILGNEMYMRSRFAEYYFGSVNPYQVFSTLKVHPDGIDMVSRMAYPAALEMRLYYALVRFDEVLRSLRDAVQALYTELEKEREKYIEQYPQFERGLAAGAINAEKLKALAKQAGSSEPRYSFSLLDPYIISHRDDDPGFLLLGHAYEKTLNTRYKYITADPYNFAQAIGTPVRYEIYQALYTYFARYGTGTCNERLCQRRCNRSSWCGRDGYLRRFIQSHYYRTGHLLFEKRHRWQSSQLHQERVPVRGRFRLIHIRAYSTRSQFALRSNPSFS